MTSKARKAETYRGHPDHVPAKLPMVYRPIIDRSKYTGAKLREIRRTKGVGRPPFQAVAAE